MNAVRVEPPTNGLRTIPPVNAWNDTGSANVAAKVPSVRSINSRTCRQLHPFLSTPRDPLSASGVVLTRWAARRSAASRRGGCESFVANSCHDSDHVGGA